MARVERGNVVLTVKEHEIQHYLNLGYNLTDDAGNILKQAIPTNIGELQTAYLEHTKKIAELEDTVAKLTAQLSVKKTTPKKAKED